MNMDHLNYLDTVRGADVALLREKEKTYRGSWKAAGGRSAWFMARRNMDRLINMLARPTTKLDRPLETVLGWTREVENGTNDKSNDVVRHERAETIRYLVQLANAEDIFAKIEEDPSGADGTVLACVRDLRCYFTLIEAEMMARGVVPVGGATPMPRPGGSEGDRYIGLGIPLSKPYREMTDDELIDERDRLVKANQEAGGWGAAVGVRGESIKEIDGELARRAEPTRPGTPEDGGHHARQSNDWPIEVLVENSSVVFDAFGVSSELRDKFWNLRGQHWVLEPFAQSRTIPRALSDWYRLSGDHTTWILRIESVPQDLRDRFPCLHRERNTVERDALHPYLRDMYEWNEGANKWELRSEFAAWVKED